MKDSQFPQDTYQTGSTRPPKSHGGAIAFLMALVIFLCGVSTALGLMNIRLFRALSQLTQQENPAPVAFSGEGEAAHTDEVCFALGFYGQEVPELWSVYQDLPKGIYITYLDPDSDAAAKGILPGDILVQVDGVEVTGAQQLHTLLEQRKDRPQLQTVLHREGEQLTVTLTLKP